MDQKTELETIYKHMVGTYPTIGQELDRLRLGHDRYETVRRMSPAQFKEAWKINIETEKPFDQIIDELRSFYFK